MERDGNLDFESAMGYFSNMFPTLTQQTIKDVLESLLIVLEENSPVFYRLYYNESDHSETC